MCVWTVRAVGESVEPLQFASALANGGETRVGFAEVAEAGTVRVCVRAWEWVRAGVCWVCG